MDSTLLNESGDRRTWALVFDPGDEVVEGLERFAREHALAGSHLTAIGALRDVVLGFWDPDRRTYEETSIDEQVEVLSLVGNIARSPDGAPKLHAHIVVSGRDGAARGGHLLAAHVHPTLEAVITEEPRRLQRRHDRRTGLALIRPS